MEYIAENNITILCNNIKSNVIKLNENSSLYNKNQIKICRIMPDICKLMIQMYCSLKRFLFIFFLFAICPATIFANCALFYQIRYSHIFCVIKKVYEATKCKKFGINSNSNKSHWLLCSQFE